MTRTRTTRYVTLFSIVLALALTAALAACGSDEPSGVTGPDRTASTPTETPASPARTPTTTGSGDATTATDAPRPTATTAPPAATGSAETDREALVALYNATGGDNWGDNWGENTGWLSDAPLGEWYGVATDDNGRVAGLDLDRNELSGEIPPELGSLANLYSLALYNNRLSGEIPPELGSLANLYYLELYKNELSGEIPPELGNLAKLVRLWLNNNQLTGEIPPELGNLVSPLSPLSLQLHENRLSGCVPSSLADHGGDIFADLPYC